MQDISAGQHTASVPETDGLRDLTVRNFLQLPQVKLGNPVVLAGEEHLDTPVRWVHIAETDAVTDLLEGGEMLLSSSPAFQHSVEHTRAFLDQARRAGAVGFAVEAIDEVGLASPRSLEVLTEAGKGAGMPVIALRSRVRFVRITQEAHRVLIGQQLSIVERTRELHEAFTELSLSGADESVIVREAARRLGTPVVLEDAAHRILAHAPADALAATENWPPSTAQAVPVGVKGRRWGRVVAPSAREDDPYAAEVLQRASQAITLVRAHSQTTYDLRMRASDHFVSELPHMSEEQALRRGRAADLHGPGGFMAIAVEMCGGGFAEDDGDAASGSVTKDEAADYQLRERGLRLELVAAAERLGLTAVTSAWRTGTVVAILGLPSSVGGSADDLTAELCCDLTEAIPETITVGAGQLSQTLVPVADDIPTAVEAAHVAAGMSIRRQPFYRFSDLRLNGLIASLSDDPRMSAFAHAELGPLLKPTTPTGPEPRGNKPREASGASSADLEFLWVYLLCGGQKAAVARQLGISRPAVYAKAGRIASTLGVSLDNPESAAALLTALLWQRSRNM
ncbi:Purine catabolism regulatory protein-like family protein [Brevibacterium ravenspurgense]|uniref:Purine catabolism regulatory protein-like family protein n=1 Tax=Brevibacterium ravenspurgense TaxID=479117 RepID=A0A150HAU8_9MICO|nr:PucR family transcriptional regulator ligand-binding domain-containing protein [Brevibacterium ravenspurgense]KXZ59171.1 Purine catabolism regulatory protein-like family protein [Brevibacterium ravenspurgense]